MSYEIINSAQVTPHRLLSLLKLVAYLGSVERSQLLDLLQPNKLVNNKEASENVLAAAFRCNLAKEINGKIQLLIDPSHISSVEAYRRFMCKNLLGITDETQPNYLLNIFSAWYYVQDMEVMRKDDQTLVAEFNQQLAKTDKQMEFNTTKLSAWERWAAFLGLGWLLRLSGSAVNLVPDSSTRLLELLSNLLPTNELISFGKFMTNLAAQCPELDGGASYNYCFTASRAATQKSNSLSLGLSTGLRVLHDSGKLELNYKSDSLEMWKIYPAEGHTYTQTYVTHIRRITGD